VSAINGMPREFRVADSGEEQLLVAAASIAIAGRQLLGHPRLSSRGLAWEKILKLAERNRVVPLLAAAVAANRISDVPQSVRQELRTRFLASARHAMTLGGELRKVLAALDAVGIRCIPLKGPVLAAGSYRSLGLRDFDDIDLLITPADVPRAAEALAKLGFQGWNVSPEHTERYLANKYECSLTCSETGVSIDLHWAICPNFFKISMEFDALWQRAGRVNILGTPVPDLSAEDAILYLCYHGGKHRFHRLAWICDIAAAIAAHPDVDWDLLLENATKAGARRLLLLGLCLAQGLLGADVPHRIGRLIQTESTLRVMVTLVLRTMFRPHTVGSALKWEIEGVLYHLRVRERVIDRFRYLCWTITPSQFDLGSSRVPTGLDFLHVLSRPIRLLRKTLATPVLRSA
jgi:Uncharacterised nucleotidyltransferase